MSFQQRPRRQMNRQGNTWSSSGSSHASTPRSTFDLKKATVFRTSTHIDKTPIPPVPPVEHQVSTENQEKNFQIGVQLQILRETINTLLTKTNLSPVVVWATATCKMTTFDMNNKEVENASVEEGERVALQLPPNDEGRVRCLRLFDNGTVQVYFVQEGGFINFSFTCAT